MISSCHAPGAAAGVLNHPIFGASALASYQHNSRPTLSTVTHSPPGQPATVAPSESVTLTPTGRDPLPPISPRPPTVTGVAAYRSTPLSQPPSAAAHPGPTSALRHRALPHGRHGRRRARASRRRWIRWPRPPGGYGRRMRPAVPRRRGIILSGGRPGREWPGGYYRVAPSLKLLPPKKPGGGGGGG